MMLFCVAAIHSVIWVTATVLRMTRTADVMLLVSRESKQQLSPASSGTERL
jgi:hypothetical protein